MAASASFAELLGRTFHVKIFGCQMNRNDAELVSGLLSNCGAVEVEAEEDADIVIFMTCCVRENADSRIYGQVASM